MNDITQGMWRGRSIGSRRDSSGKRYTVMLGRSALMFVPIKVEPNSQYRFFVEAKRESGNGKAFCNIYSNKNFDFKQVYFELSESEWMLYEAVLSTGEFPKSMPMTFRIWRPKDGNGNIFIRKISMEKIEDKAVENSEPPVVRKPLASDHAVAVKSVVKTNTQTEKPEAEPQKRSKKRRTRRARRIHVGRRVAGRTSLDKNKQTEPCKVLLVSGNQIFLKRLGTDLKKLGFICYAVLPKDGVHTVAQNMKPDWIHFHIADDATSESSKIMNGIIKASPGAVITAWSDIPSDSNAKSVLLRADFAFAPEETLEGWSISGINPKSWDGTNATAIESFLESEECEIKSPKSPKSVSSAKRANRASRASHATSKMVGRRKIQRKTVKKILASININDFITRHNRNADGIRVLYLPLNSLEIGQMGMEAAFLENGFCLRVFDFRNAARKCRLVDEAFIQQAKEFQPHWIHMQLQFSNTISPLTVAKIKEMLPNTVITNWTGDCRKEANGYFVNISEKVDLSLISSEGQINLYKRAGTQNVEYWQIGVDPDQFHPLSETERVGLRQAYSHDIAFCASKTSNSSFPASSLRTSIAHELKRKYGKRFGLYGRGWGRGNRGEVGYYRQNDVYNASKIAISVNHFNNVRMYFSDRQLITMASGALVICHYIPGLEEYFENGKDLVWFHTKGECFSLIDYYLQHPEEAKQIGTRGAQKVLSQHSYSCRVRELALRLGFVKSERGIDEFRPLYRPADRSLRVMSYYPKATREFLFRRDLTDLELQVVRCDLLRNAAQFQPDWLHIHLPDGSSELRAKEVQDIRSKIPDMTMTAWLSDDIGENDRLLSKFLDHVFVNTKEQAQDLQASGVQRLDQWPMDIQDFKNAALFHRRVTEMSERIAIGKPKGIQIRRENRNEQFDMSIVMGTYNRLDMLENTVKRLFDSAGDRKIEIIINDAGSTDGTIEWLEENSKSCSIVPIFSGKKTGITRAYNDGFKIARGKYVSWFSDDVMPVGNAIKNMCELMDGLDPEDMGAYPIRDSKNAPFRVPFLLGFPAPTVACMFTSTLKKYNYWNTDYPYYGQDNEVNARVLRMGGKIVVCDIAHVDHLNRQDDLKHKNVKSYSAMGHGQKFHIIHWRYGKQEELMYPKVLLVPYNSANGDHVLAALEKLRKHYLNAHYFVSKEVDGICLDEHDIKNLSLSLPECGPSLFEHYDLTVAVYPDRCEVITPNDRVRKMRFAKEMWK